MPASYEQRAPYDANSEHVRGGVVAHVARSTDVHEVHRRRPSHLRGPRARRRCARLEAVRLLTAIECALLYLV